MAMFSGVTVYWDKVSNMALGEVVVGFGLGLG
jgi:hypothetical protein